MFVCGKCNRVMKPKKTGIGLVELAQDEPYKLWMADLWECSDCGSLVLYTHASQQPIAEHYQPDFAAKMATYSPQFQAKEWNR